MARSRSPGPCLLVVPFRQMAAYFLNRGKTGREREVTGKGAGLHTGPTDQGMGGSMGGFHAGGVGLGSGSGGATGAGLGFRPWRLGGLKGLTRV